MIIIFCLDIITSKCLETQGMLMLVDICHIYTYVIYILYNIL